MMAEKVTIGRAELWHGDCMEILHALPQDAALVTDPPYGISYVHSGGGGASSTLEGAHRLGKPPPDTTPIHGDDKPVDPAPWLGFEKIVIFGAEHFKTRLPEGGRFLCWDKSLGVGPADSFTDAEFAWTSEPTKRNVFRLMWKGLCCDKAEEDLMDGQFRRHHTSQKPLPLMRWAIELLRMKPGSVILDPYMGSGSTGVAALSLGMRFVGAEIDRAHFEIACARMEAAQRQPELAFA